MWEKGCTNGIRIVKIAHISHDFVGICFNLVYMWKSHVVYKGRIRRSP